MKRFFPLFFLFVMASNVALPALERLGGSFFEIEKSASAVEKSSTEKGEPKVDETEKQPLAVAAFEVPHAPFFFQKKLRKSPASGDERFVSELFAESPEQPPEA